MVLTTQVWEFQECVRTRVQKQYTQNYNVVTFLSGDIVTLCILKKDRASTNNHGPLYMVKNIPNDGRHFLQIQFSVLDRLYPTRELNVVPEVNQIVLRSEFEKASSKAITLHALATKVRTSNKVAVCYTCKKRCSPKFQCNCQKQKLKCIYYCHWWAQSYRNMVTINERRGTTVVDRPANNFDSDSLSLLPSNSDHDASLSEELKHSLLMPLDEKRLEQQPLAPTLDIHFLNQRCGRKPSSKKPCANISSHQKWNEINMEAKAKAHSEIVGGLNSEIMKQSFLNFSWLLWLFEGLEGCKAKMKEGRKVKGKLLKRILFSIYKLTWY